MTLIVCIMTLIISVESVYIIHLGHELKRYEHLFSHMEETILTAISDGKIDKREDDMIHKYFNDSHDPMKAVDLHVK